MRSNPLQQRLIFLEEISFTNALGESIHKIFQQFLNACRITRYLDFPLLLQRVAKVDFPKFAQQGRSILGQKFFVEWGRNPKGRGKGRESQIFTQSHIMQIFISLGHIQLFPFLAQTASFLSVIFFTLTSYFSSTCVFLDTEFCRTYSKMSCYPS